VSYFSVRCFFAREEASLYGPYKECPDDPDSCLTGPGGEGVEGVDFVLYVTAIEHEQLCAGTSGFADACGWDPRRSRPTVGYLNICPSALITDEAAFDDQLVGVVHHIMHALLMSSSNFEHFVDADGEPRPTKSFLATVPPPPPFFPSLRAPYQAFISLPLVENITNPHTINSISISVCVALTKTQTISAVPAHLR
jgi:hypothetical protein